MKRLMFAAVAAISLGVTAFAGTEPTCSGGDYVYSLQNGDKTDWVHVFSNGTGSVAFTVPSNVKGTFEVQYLLVAGGGGGGAYKGGGGGAGRVTTGTLTLGANDRVQVTVGAGGAGGTRLKDGVGLESAVNGGDSIVKASGGSELRALGGGHGGNYGEAGAAGGCGGGGAVSKKDGGSGVGEPTSNGCKANATYGGGGGGAGGSPEAIGTSKGTGGPGVSSSISGAERVYGVGGFGSNAFDEHVDGGAGEDGTGNGGNALSGYGTGGKGGDGVVILRYTEPETSGEAYAFGEVADQVYTGAALEPAIVVTKGAATLEQGTDYEVAYFDNVNAGTARAEIAGLGDHEGQLTGTVSFTIAPAANEWTVEPTVEPAAWLKSAVPGVFSASAKFGTVVISYEGADSPSSQVGTHTATFSVAGTENYAGLPETDVTYTVVIHDGEPDTEAVTYTWNNPEGGDWIAPANWSASLEESFGFPYSKDFATALFGEMEGVEALTVRVTDVVMSKQLRFESAPAVTLDLCGNSYDAKEVYSLLAGLVTVSNGTLEANFTGNKSEVNFSGKGLTVGPGGTMSIRHFNAGTNPVQIVSRDGGDLSIGRFVSSAGSSGLIVRAEGEGANLSFGCQFSRDFNSTNWVLEARNGGKVTPVGADFTRGERDGAFIAADGAIAFVNDDQPFFFGTNVTDEACGGARISISGRNGMFYSDRGADIVFGSNAEEAQSLAVPPALEIAIPADGFAAVPLEAKPYKNTLFPDVVIGSNVVVRLDVSDAAKRGEVCLMRAAGEINVDLARLTARTKGRGVDFAYELRTTEAEAQELWLSYRKTSGLALFVR